MSNAISRPELQLPATDYWYAFDMCAVEAAGGIVRLITSDNYAQHELERRLSQSLIDNHAEASIAVDTLILVFPSRDDIDSLDQWLATLKPDGNVILLTSGFLHRFISGLRPPIATTHEQINMGQVRAVLKSRGWQIARHYTLHGVITVLWSYIYRLWTHLHQPALADRALQRGRKRFVMGDGGLTSSIGTLSVDVVRQKRAYPRTATTTSKMTVQAIDSAPPAETVSKESPRLMEGIVQKAVAGLDAWFETMRTPQGYGGAVVHWWQNSLHYTGAGLDWRYEGILSGYVMLYEKTCNPLWLSRAVQAGNDLVGGQLASGNFRNSQFQLNPYSGGTPHEAGCAAALLRLGQILYAQGDDRWRRYCEAAQNTLDQYYIGCLWDEQQHTFCDNLTHTTIVPNKNATLTEALLLLAELTGQDIYAEKYARKTLDSLLNFVITEGELRGAVYQLSENGSFRPWFFPYYAARCIPGLLAGYRTFDDQRYLDAAMNIMRFVAHHAQPDGSLPQIIYPQKKQNLNPRWVSGIGDVLMANHQLTAYGQSSDLTTTQDWLLQGQQPTGAFQTALGFGHLASKNPGNTRNVLPDFRDVLPVCGWTDKAFRYLVSQLPHESDLQPITTFVPWQTACLLDGKPMIYGEDQSTIELSHKDSGGVIYRMMKGADWAEVCDPVSMWK